MQLQSINFSVFNDILQIPVMKKGILAASSLLIFLFGAIYLPPAQATGLLNPKVQFQIPIEKN